MSEPQWEVRIRVSEELVRQYHEQTPEDPPTDESAVKDAISEILDEGVCAAFGIPAAHTAAEGTAPKRSLTVLDARRA